jgi:cytosine/adenosine deaminase-related metal-dependent hydrolase
MSDFAVSGARVFDGEHSLGVVDVQVHDGTVTAVGGPLPGDVEVIDGNGATLLPGLIDAHVHDPLAVLAGVLSKRLLRNPPST